MDVVPATIFGNKNSPVDVTTRGFVLVRICFSRRSLIPVRLFAYLSINCGWIELEFDDNWGTALVLGCLEGGE